MKRFGYHDNPVLEARLPMWRAKLVFIAIAVGFLALLFKALHLQGLSTEFLQQQGERRYERSLVLPPTRGKVFDRTGNVVLASSVPVRAVWAIPDDARKASTEQLRQLATLLDMSLAYILRRPADEDKSFGCLRPLHRVA